MVRWTLLFVVLIIFASGAVAFYTVFFEPSGEIAVPPLRDRSVVDAVADAERLGFAVQIEPVASTLPEGRVLAQSPEPGTRARKKEIIVLQVSRSGELHAVPDVRGQSLSAAQNVIKEQGFTTGDVIRIKEKGQPGGTVIAQSPASPANISVSRKINLLVNEGGSDADNAVIIPDVNRMTEKEARSLLSSKGIKVQAVDRVYSPMMSEGLAIETRPGAGTSLKPGGSVTLKIATLRRPAGYTEPTSEPENKSVRRVTTTPAQTSQAPAPSGTSPAGSQTQTRGQTGVTVSVRGQGDIFIGDGTTPANTPIREANPNVSVIDQERRPPTAGQQTRTAPASPSASSAPSASASVSASSSSASGSSPARTTGGGGTKTARINYQVPPLSSAMNLRIEVTDPAGKRDILNRQARSGESISLETSYTQECVVTIYLGGQVVWQEKKR